MFKYGRRRWLEHKDIHCGVILEDWSLVLKSFKETHAKEEVLKEELRNMRALMKKIERL